MSAFLIAVASTPTNREGTHKYLLNESIKFQRAATSISSFSWPSVSQDLSPLHR